MFIEKDWRVDSSRQRFQPTGEVHGVSDHRELLALRAANLAHDGIPAGDADALAATIARGLDDPELRARIGEAGRTRVLDRWTWRRCAELTVEQYREVLAMPANVAKLRANGRP